MSTERNTGVTIIIVLLVLIFWTIADFYGDYKKNNMTEQDKAEIVLDKKAQQIIDAQQDQEFKSIGMIEFKDVKSEQLPDWIAYQALNNLFVKIGITFALVAGFGFWFTNRKINL